ncbi:MAG TPA: trigger factor [Candidatus Limnocylindrales bacterium]|nr:trigger factor [Candidatus Limnocylindrales bacterium]
MKVTTTPAPKSTVLLEVELPAERVKRSIDESVRHLSRRTKVPGFRPGKVPRPMLERALGVRRDEPDAPNPIVDDAKEHLFEASVIDALREADLDVLSVPEPEWLRFEEGAGAAYRVQLAVRPEVQLGAYTDYPFGIDIEEIDDEKVERVVEQLRDQHASLVPVEGRGAQDGDYAVIAFEGSREGQPFEGGSAERFPLVIGSDRLIPGFEGHLLGLREGEETDFSLTFPDDYPDESLGGKPADFHVRLVELREKRPPEADDDFAASLGDYADMAALRAEIRRRLEANAKDHARHAFSSRIIDFAVDNSRVELPDVLVEREVEVMHDELRVRLAEQGIGYEEYLKVVGKDDAALHAEYRQPAERRVKTLLVISAIADREGVEVEDAEVEAEVARARQRYAESPKLLSYLDSPRGRAYIRATLRRSRTVEQLVERWLAAHPEVGPVPHLEDESSHAPVNTAVQEGTPA